ncbi:MAG: FAD-binding oxidoreductase [Pseudomonadota bacterium]
MTSLAASLGPGGALTPEEAPRYLEEPRGRYAGRAAMIARPADAASVAALIRACAEARVGVVPWGGGTGLVAGQTALSGPRPILLSLERMQAIRGVSAEENALVAEAGATLQAVQEAAAQAGRLFPLSLASEGSCRIGGNLATNAGGVAVLRYGNARDLCLGLEAVLPDGSLYAGLTSLRKDNTGYDLRHLLIGSEGTLGVITAASLKLFAAPAERVTAMVALPSAEAGVALLRRLQDALGETISAFELISEQSFHFLSEAEIEHVRAPFDPAPPFAALIEIGAAGGSSARPAFEEALAGALEAALALDAVLAESEAQRGALWRLREEIPSANRRIGAVASHDIALPISAVPAFMKEAEAAIRGFDPRLRVNAFGHLGDGNLHYNLFPPKGVSRSEFDDSRAAASRIVHDLTHAHAGSISAEHGIGRLKADDLARYGDPAKLSAMRAIKQALDPLGVMNPGALGV